MKTNNTKKDSLTGSFMLLLTALIWGLAFTAQSVGMKYIGPFTFNCVRMLIGGAVLIPITAAFRSLDRREGSRDISVRRTVTGGIVCGTVLCAASAFQQCGIVLTSAGKAGFITALYIVIVPILEWILYKRASRRIGICVFIALCGFYLLCVKEDMSLGRGDLLVLVCALLFAVHIMVIDRYAAQNTDGMAMSCIQFITAGLIFFVFTAICEKPDIHSIFAAWRPVLYAGIMSCGAGYTLQILGQRRTPPAAATLLMSLESVFAALAGWLILGERLLPKELLGCILVFTAVILAQLSPLTSIQKGGKNEQTI